MFDDGYVEAPRLSRSPANVNGQRFAKRSDGRLSSVQVERHTSPDDGFARIELFKRILRA